MNTNGWTKFFNWKGKRVRVSRKGSCPICGSKLSVEFQINDEGQTAINCTNDKCSWWILGQVSG